MDNFSDAHLGDELARARETIENLHVALNTCRQIGIAMGILMATTKVTEDDAFAILVKVSQRAGRKLRDIAAVVAETGTFDSVYDA